MAELKDGGAIKVGLSRHRRSAGCMRGRAAETCCHFSK